LPGAVKEVRETPGKPHHKFVEFFDVRDAAGALKEMDRQYIGGRRVRIEISRPGGKDPIKSQIHAKALMPNTAPFQNTDCLQQQRWKSDKEVYTQPASTSLYVHPTNIKEGRTTEGQMGIGPTRGGQGVGLGESGFGRSLGGNGSYMKPKNCTKISTANGCRPSAAAAAALTTHNQENGIQVMPQFAFDEAEAVSNCTKARTTIMIKNIPNKYK